MIAQSAPYWRLGAILSQRLVQVMDIVLHIGAHRTGTTTFQRALTQNEPLLEENKIVFWGPQITRKGLLDGVIPTPVNRRARRNLQTHATGRVKMRLEQLRQQGCETLIVSEENMLGNMRANLREGELYPSAGVRMARFYEAFGGQISRVVLSVRSLDRFWSSACSFLVARGQSVPGSKRLQDLTFARRSWRDVVCDVACAMPDTDLQVMPFETCYANPQSMMRDGIGLPLKLEGKFEWANRAPEVKALRETLRERGQNMDQIVGDPGPWCPFTDAQVAELKERYSEDLFWLMDGAEGFATLTQESTAADRGKAHHAAPHRGHDNDEEGSLEGAS